MRFVAPDVLAELCGLSPGVVGLAAGVGAVLWLFGWWSHRFWVVLIATVAAGVWGLFEAPILKAQPLVASLLLALAAGLLALALIRLFAFVAVGLIGLAFVDALAPNMEQPLIAFLSSGLVGLILFRWCVTAVLSFTGSVLLVHAVLVMLNQRGKLDAAVYAETSAAMLTGLISLMTLFGFGFQLWHDRHRRRRVDDSKSPKKKPKEKEKDKEPESRGILGFLRKAG